MHDLPPAGARRLLRMVRSCIGGHKHAQGFERIKLCDGCYTRQVTAAEPGLNRHAVDAWARKIEADLKKPGRERIADEFFTVPTDGRNLRGD